MLRIALRAGWIAAVLLVLTALNAGFGNVQDYWQDVIKLCGISVILAVSLNIVNGFTGQFSIGHAGFMAVGAYAGGATSYLLWERAKDVIARQHPGWSSEQVLNQFAASNWWLL